MSNIVKLTQDANYVYHNVDGNVSATFTTCGEFGNCSAVSLVTKKGTYLIPCTRIGNSHRGPATYKGYAGKYSITITTPVCGEMLVEWDEPKPAQPNVSAGYLAAKMELSRRFEPIGAPAFLRGTWGR